MKITSTIENFRLKTQIKAYIICWVQMHCSVWANQAPRVANSLQSIATDFEIFISLKHFTDFT